MAIIKTTKESEKKQVALNAGNKIIERIKEVSNSGDIKSSDTVISLSTDLVLKKNADNVFDGKQLLDSNGKNTSSDCKYIALVNLSKNDLSLNSDSKIGYLYDVTVTITDSNNNVLFNEKYNQIIKIN